MAGRWWRSTTRVLAGEEVTSETIRMRNFGRIWVEQWDFTQLFLLYPLSFPQSSNYRSVGRWRARWLRAERMFYSEQHTGDCGKLHAGGAGPGAGNSEDHEENHGRRRENITRVWRCALWMQAQGTAMVRNAGGGWWEVSFGQHP